jgi:regulator of sigma E protease
LPLPTLPPLWKRLVFVSGGIVISMILGWGCLAVVCMRGIQHLPAVVGTVDSGSAAWIQGVPTGAVIHQIGEVKNPFFEDLSSQVLNSADGQTLPLVYSLPGDDKTTALEIQPRLDTGSLRPVLGISPPSSLILLGDERTSSRPVTPDSAAARANPPFAPGDVILATTDPDNPQQVKPLPVDPRDPESRPGDYFEFCRRMRRLANKDITVLVRRADGKQESIQLPAAFHFSLGVRMRMSPIAAVRTNSPAARAGIQTADDRRRTQGDQVVAVAVAGPDGKTVRFDEKNLDPLRLPDQLRQWAWRMASAGKAAERVVTLEIRRHRLEPGGPELEAKTFRMDWDAGWEFQRDLPYTANSPIAIPELGLAYHVSTTVAGFEPDRDGAGADSLQPGDVIEAVQIPVGSDKENKLRAIRRVLERQQGAYLFVLLQHGAAQEIDLDLTRAGERRHMTLKLREDPTWPAEDRGLLLAPAIRTRYPHDFIDALRTAFRDVINRFGQVASNLRMILLGRLERRNLGGPIVIRSSSRPPLTDLSSLLTFLGLFSLQFALLNLLPIPLTDGGEAVLFVVEKLRGRPLASSMRVSAYCLGAMLFLGCIMLPVWMDLSRFLN